MSKMKNKNKEMKIVTISISQKKGSNKTTFRFDNK